MTKPVETTLGNIGFKLHVFWPESDVDGDGEFRFAENPTWGKETESTLRHFGERYEGNDCKRFREVTGANYNDGLTGVRILEAFQTIYQPNT